MEEIHELDVYEQDRGPILNKVTEAKKGWRKFVNIFRKKDKPKLKPEIEFEEYK